MRPLLLPLLALAACAPKVPRFPGPLHPVGQVRPPRDAPPPAEPAIAAAARPAPVIPGRQKRRRSSDTGEVIASAAMHYLDHRPRGFRDDCSGFVSAALSRAGIALDGSAAAMWDEAVALAVTHRRKDPDLGDIAFFDDTYDRNRDGRWNDPLSHVGVVIDVTRSGDILLAHAGTSQGRTTLHMNLERPHDRTDPDTGEPINDYLRRKSSRDPAGARYLASELWRGFATFSRAGENAVADADPPEAQGSSAP